MNHTHTHTYMYIRTHAQIQPKRDNREDETEMVQSLDPNYYIRNIIICYPSYHLEIIHHNKRQTK